VRLFVGINICHFLTGLPVGIVNPSPKLCQLHRILPVALGPIISRAITALPLDEPAVIFTFLVTAAEIAQRYLNLKKSATKIPTEAAV